MIHLGQTRARDHQRLLPLKGGLCDHIQARNFSPSLSRNTGSQTSHSTSMSRRRSTTRTVSPMPRPPVHQKPQPQIAVKHRRIADRGDMALAVHPAQIRPRHKQMRARGDLLRRPAACSPTICARSGPSMPARVAASLPMQSFLAETIFCRANIKGRHPPVNLGMGDKALLDPQHVQRLHAIRPAAHGLGPRHKVTEQRLAIARRHRNLIAFLARER